MAYIWRNPRQVVERLSRLVEPVRGIMCDKFLSIEKAEGQLQTQAAISDELGNIVEELRTIAEELRAEGRPTGNIAHFPSKAEDVSVGPQLLFAYALRALFL